ncbi:MAG: AIPR family protein [Anaerolineae bacterium]|nr:AIPR family protein [Anaerolineae bacterium]
MVWRLFRNWYLKSFGDPQPQTLHFVCPYTKFENVYLGVLAASEIRRIYEETGDAIFFENVRDFTGYTDVNQKIAATIKDEPAQFLPLNNGIVFSTSSVEEIDLTTLTLDRASIVNGCQTTTTIVQTLPPEGTECFLQVKIVKIDEEPTSWKVTHAANYQNEINRIDLDLSRYIRPQIVKKQSWLSGIPLSDDNDAWSIITVFNNQKVTWKNVRILFIGLFSRDPGNMFDVNFGAVEGDLLALFLQDKELNQKLFDVVFALHEASERGSDNAREWLAGDEQMREIFSRLLGDTRAPYMQFLTILAICALADMNIAQREEPLQKEFDRMKLIVKQFHEVLESQKEELNYAYFVAFEKVANDVLTTVETGDRAAISRLMYSRITKRDRFTNLFLQVKLGIQSAKRGREIY